MAGPARAKLFDSIGSRLALAAISASFVFYFWRLARFVTSNAVDVPYWDLWDVLDPLFRDEGLWAAFQYQHGPVRQGLGALLFFVSNAATDWSLVAPAFENLVLLGVCALLAIELKVAIFGRLTVFDALIPAIFFRVGQYSTLVMIPYPAHGVLPLLLVLLACRAFLIRGARMQLASFGVISFFAAHTGFAMFLPPVLVGVASLAGTAAWRAGRFDSARRSLVVAAVVALCAAPALVGLNAGKFGAIPCPDAPGPVDYVAYVVMMLNGSFGFPRRDTAALILGAGVLLLPALLVLAASVRRAATAAREGAASHVTAGPLVVIVLIGFALLFASASAPGRICAEGAALSSRYVSLMAPFALGLYFGICAWRDFELVRRICLAAMTVLVCLGALVLTPVDELVVETTVTGKLRWIECVRSGGSAADCNRRAQFEIHPAPEGSRIDEKLEYLRRNRLSFFAPRDE
ncbi:MAG: hypothetical protein ACSLFQ_07505 [Thermoanaerobaculia bacterium]